jgi:uncharacterized protein YigA (DUF484 family)
MSDDKASLEQVVAEYLRENSNFLIEHPDILEHVEVSHDSGTASSLIERQVRQLRASNEDLSRRLNRLVQVASENERLMSRLHRLTLDLLSIGSRQDFFAHLTDSLLNDFNADIVTVCLFDSEGAGDAGDNVRGIGSDDPALDPFRGLLDKDRTVCGRLSESKLEFLFDKRAPWVQSTAFVPLGDKGADGMMVIGSSDPARFFPGMGTLFLDLLADVISVSLSAREPEAKRRSA